MFLKTLSRYKSSTNALDLGSWALCLTFKKAVYGPDRVFVWLRTADSPDTDTEAKLTTLEKAGHPVIRIVIHDALHLGAEFLRWELATATAGAVLGLNPFDEPNVAESKQNTNDLLHEWQQRRIFSTAQPVVQAGDIAIYCEQTQPWVPKGQGSTPGAFLQAFVDLAMTPDYLALLALLPAYRGTPSGVTDLAPGAA